MIYLYIKAFHLVFIVTWFSGLFYLGRLLVYWREAHDSVSGSAGEHALGLSTMTRRLLFAITWPSLVLTVVLGTTLSVLNAALPPWLIVKFVLVSLLIVYHVSLHRIYRKHKLGMFPYTSRQLRLWNEVPTILLITIVLLAILKDQASLLFLVIALGILTSLIVFAVRRTSSNNTP